MIEVGKTYKTYGGWDAKVIWEKWGDGSGFYVIHKPGTSEESPPIFHLDYGKSKTVFSVNEPPSYDHHPADLILE